MFERLKKHIMNDISKDKDYQEFFACTEVAFGTGDGLLWYGICAPCSKRLPGVRGAFSEAFGVKNRLFWYRSDIRYRKPPSLVRSRYSVRRTAFCGTRRISFRGPRCAEPPPAPSGALKNRPSARAESRFWCLAAGAALRS